MKRIAALIFSLPYFCCAQAPTRSLPVDSASVAISTVPKGEILKRTFTNSRIYPGSTREYWVYVPRQYDPETPACLYVNQDAIQANAPVVFDNLIAAKEMPITIGVFIASGKIIAPDHRTASDRLNRSLEYDGLGDAYVRFLLEELLPDVERQKTSDGRPIRLSTKSSDRAIGGLSSGAIAAFTAAWERPDAFSRVVSGIGTYVGLRGGDRYPTLIRKTEPKAIRVFLQDGSNDINNASGDWWMANQMMERSLTFAGYQVRHEYGDGGHSPAHLTSLFPTVMRWLWKGWPAPVLAGESKNQMMKDILIPGEGWQELKGQIRAPALNRVTSSKRITFKLPKGMTGLALTPDQSQLYTAEKGSHWLHLFSIKADGTLINGQRYGWLHVPDNSDDAGTSSVSCDTAGRVFVATRMGIQVLDQIGRVNVILPLPSGSPTVSWLGGENGDVLFAIAGDKIYSRKLKTKGVDPTKPPVRPIKSRL